LECLLAINTAICSERGCLSPMSNIEQTVKWLIAELLDQPGGHISIGRMPPIEGAAIAINDQGLLASLVRREGETFPDLLTRLDAAVAKAVHEGVVTNDVNGGRFRLAPSSIRKKR
jgi:hypothetical protein